MRTKFLLTLQVALLLSFPMGAFAGEEKLGMSVAEATEFCEKVWLPRLRMGHTPSPEELKVATARLLELYTDDIEMIDPNSFDQVHAGSFKGKTQIGKYYEWILSKYPEWNIKILEIYPTTKGFAMRYEGTNAPPVDKFEGVDILEFRNVQGRPIISKIMMYYDRVPFRAKKAK